MCDNRRYYTCTHTDVEIEIPMLQIRNYYPVISICFSWACATFLTVVNIINWHFETILFHFYSLVAVAAFFRLFYLYLFVFFVRKCLYCHCVAWVDCFFVNYVHIREKRNQTMHTHSADIYSIQFYENLCAMLQFSIWFFSVCFFLSFIHTSLSLSSRWCSFTVQLLILF